MIYLFRKPRTVIVRLQKSNDRNNILKNSHKLKGSGIFINDDVSEGTMKVRKEKLEKLKDARSKGKIAYFIGRNLIIRDRNETTTRSYTPTRRHSVSSLINVYSPDDMSQNVSAPQSCSQPQTLNVSQRTGLRPSSNINYKV